MNHIGFTFDEKILLHQSLEAFMFELNGLFTDIEIAPDKSILSIADYQSIVAYSQSHHFHVPYFVKNSNYDFSSPQYPKAFDHFFTIIDKLRQYSIKTPSIVIHASNGPKAEYTTLKGLDYLLNFITKKNMDVTLCLENLGNDVSEFAQTVPNIATFIKTFDDPRLAICYDAAHDFYREGYKIMDSHYDALIKHVHLHGKNTQKHQSIAYLPLDQIHVPKACNINLELLVQQEFKDYKEALIKDLKYLKRNTPYAD